jgi:hypothetical protein
MPLLLKRILNELHDITSVINPHVSEGMTMMSCPACLLQKISETTDHLCHIALNQKLLCKFKKWCTFSSCDKAKSHKMRPACTSKKYRSRNSKEERYLCLMLHQAILFYPNDCCEISMNKISVLTTYLQVQMLDGLIHTRRPISLELNGS